MKVAASSLRKGSVVDLDGKLYVVLSAENIHPGKGTPVTQLNMRRISDGVKVSERYRTTEQVERAFVDDRDHTFLYQDGEGFHFMNPETYELEPVDGSVLGDNFKFVKENMECTIYSYKGKVFNVEPPFFVDLEVTATDPGFAGNTATNATKPATLETGAEIKVPLFIETGEIIRVDTRTGEYLSRA